ncbi:cytochrome c [bacterium SGD-2]|nr:cytochrome c [bacterium SGD-2]
MKPLAMGLAFMLAIAAIGIAYDFHKASQMPAGFCIDTRDARLVASGRVLYMSHCAACHGAALEGQPNWRERRENGRLPAPPHDESGHTWHHPDWVLFDITRNGLVPGHTAPPGYESDMPAYAGILSDDEIIAILAYIKSTWSPEIRTLHDEVNRNAWQGGAR